MRESALRIGVVYPELLGTYGDGGNAVVLARRAAWRDVAVELVDVFSDQALPTLDVYCLGGGEDGPQERAAAGLRAGDALATAVSSGAVVLAVCAGFQIVGTRFPGGAGAPVPGVGLLDVETIRPEAERRARPWPERPGARGAKSGGTVSPRLVGEVVADPFPMDRSLPAPVLPRITGFENHASVTRVGPGARPLAKVATGHGNGAGDGTEGAWQGRVLGTYLHGPVLARNPALADLLLSWALGADEPLAPLDDAGEDALRAERLTAADQPEPWDWDWHGWRRWPAELVRRWERRAGR